MPFLYSLLLYCSCMIECEWSTMQSHHANNMNPWQLTFLQSLLASSSSGNTQQTMHQQDLQGLLQLAGRQRTQHQRCQLNIPCQCCQLSREGKWKVASRVFLVQYIQLTSECNLNTHHCVHVGQGRRRTLVGRWTLQLTREVDSSQSISVHCAAQLTRDYTHTIGC